MIGDIYAAQEKQAFDIRPGDAIWYEDQRIEIAYVAWAPPENPWNESTRVLYSATSKVAIFYWDEVVLQLGEAL